MQSLKSIVEETNSKGGFVFDVFIQLMVILSLIAFSVETLPDLSQEVVGWLHIFEMFSIAVFSLEYVLRVFVAKPKLKYMLSFFGIIDLLAVLPSLVGMGGTKEG